MALYEHHVMRPAFEIWWSEPLKKKINAKKLKNLGIWSSNVKKLYKIEVFEALKYAKAATVVLQQITLWGTLFSLIMQSHED